MSGQSGSGGNVWSMLCNVEVVGSAGYPGHKLVSRGSFTCEIWGNSEEIMT